MEKETLKYEFVNSIVEKETLRYEFVSVWDP